MCTGKKVHARSPEFVTKYGKSTLTSVELFYNSCLQPTPRNAAKNTKLALTLILPARRSKKTTSCRLEFKLPLKGQ